MITMTSKCPRCRSSAFKPIKTVQRMKGTQSGYPVAACEFCAPYKDGRFEGEPEPGYLGQLRLVSDGGVREGTNRTTSGTIGQP